MNKKIIQGNPFGEMLSANGDSEYLDMGINHNGAINTYLNVDGDGNSSLETEITNIKSDISKLQSDLSSKNSQKTILDSDILELQNRIRTVPTAMKAGLNLLLQEKQMNQESLINDINNSQAELTAAKSLLSIKQNALSKLPQYGGGGSSLLDAPKNSGNSSGMPSDTKVAGYVNMNPILKWGLYIAGASALGFGIYKLVKHFKK